MKSVLVIIADDLLREQVRALLEEDNFTPLLAADAVAGLENLYRERPQLVIVDLPLAGMHCADLCREICGARRRAPLIFLGEAMDELEPVLLLESGADDYLVKPFYERELRARIRAVLRPTASRLGPGILFGDVEIDFEKRVVKRRGDEIKLTRSEYNLLLFFVRNADRALTRDTILTEVWGYEFCSNTRTIDSHVVKLRSKLEPDPRLPCHFLTVHGVGYRFRMSPAKIPFVPPALMVAERPST